jgi:hypothetical protein
MREIWLPSSIGQPTKLAMIYGRRNPQAGPGHDDFTDTDSEYTILFGTL